MNEKEIKSLLMCIKTDNCTSCGLICVINKNNTEKECEIKVY